MSKDPIEVTFVGPRASKSHKRKKKSKEAEAKLKSRRAAKVEAKQPKERLEAAFLGAFRRSIKQLLCHPPIVLEKMSDSGWIRTFPVSRPGS